MDEARKGGALKDPKTERYFVRLRLPTGERRRFWLPHNISDARAQDMAAAMRERLRTSPESYVVIPRKRPSSTLKSSNDAAGGEKWWAALFKHRADRGLSPVAGIFNAHLRPVLGDKHPCGWTREDCERVVASLDEKISAKTLSWKTAANAWSLFTRACKVASSAKAGTGLRVRADNPAAGVEGPDRGAKKEKQWLYPTEFEALVSCDRVPLRWRRLYTLLAYTYLRPNELSVLDWSDVDLDVGTIHVAKAWDEKQQRVKAPKTAAGVRYVPIEPALLPLLKTMRQEAGGKGPVYAPMPPMEDWAAKLRRHLARAGVTRAALFLDSETHKQVTLYDLRATGITWRCLRKDYGPEIQEAAGHEKFDTTNGYIRTARVFVGRVGEPFPALPLGHLVARPSVSARSETSIFVTPAGIEPALPA
jgi:integrase